MNISHISNSFITVKCSKLEIACDPWVGTANFGGWHSYPEYERQDLINHLKNIDYVYISHIHDDHYDQNFLESSGLNKKKFLIKNFKNKILFNRLSKLGVTEIHELNPFQVYDFDGVRISIIPQMSSNNSDIEESVNYDLDTSIVFNELKVTFFNQVDNPLSVENYLEIKKFINDNFGDISLAALTCGAASEYPQSFLNIDRKEAKEKVINASLNKLERKLDILNPSYFFPAGGTYFIPGKLSYLNQYLAFPDFSRIEAHILQSKLSAIPIFLENGSCINLKNTGQVEVRKKKELNLATETIQASIDAHASDSYDYEDFKCEENLEELNLIFLQAKENWLKIIKEKSINLSQSINFKVFNIMKLSPSGNIETISLIDEFSLVKNPELGHLNIYIHIQAFQKCLTRKQVWNGTIGALCLFERDPDIFYPDSTFSLNYLSISKEELLEIQSLKAN